MNTILINKKTRVLYEVIAEDTYKNLLTGVQGKYRKETARNFFAIPMRLSLMIAQNPNIIELIKLNIFDYSFKDEQGNTISTIRATL